MALQAELEFLGLGTASAYWRCGGLLWSAGNPLELEIRLDGYASQAAYQNGVGAIASKIVVIPLPLADTEDEHTSAFNQVRTLIYEYSKAAVPEFSSAIDV